MTKRVFENWTPESVPCPRCRTLLPAADAACPRCERELPVGVPARPMPAPAFTPPAQWTPPPGGYPPPPADYQPHYARMVPTHQRSRVGWIVLVVVIAAVLAGTAYGLHRITARADHEVAAAVTPPVVTLSPDVSGSMTLSGIPIRADELPDGWTLVPPSPDSDHSGRATPAGCEDRVHPDEQRLEKAQSQFEENGYVVISEAQRLASNAELRADLAQLKSPRASRCLRAFFTRALRPDIPGVEAHAVKVRLRFGSAGGPGNVVATFSGGVTFAANGRSIRVYIDVVMIEGDRVESTVIFMRAGLPVDSWLRDPLVAAVAERTAQL